MRFDLFVLLVLILAVLHARIDLVSASKLRESGVEAPSFESKTARRRLRADPVDDNVVEDRGWLPSWVNKRMEFRNAKKLVGNSPHTEEALKLLHLDKKTTLQDGAVDKKLVMELFKDSAFKFWVKQSLKHPATRNQLDRDLDVYQYLVKTCNDLDNPGASVNKVAEIIGLAKQSWQTKRLANRLEKMQFRVWQGQFQLDESKATTALVGTRSAKAWEEAVLKQYKKFLEAK